MSIHKQITVDCDVCGDFYDDSWGRTDLLRDALRTDGWKRRKDKHGRLEDICPKCVAETNATQ